MASNKLLRTFVFACGVAGLTPSHAADCRSGFDLLGLVSMQSSAAAERPVDPQIKRLVLNVVKSYACQKLINHFAEEIKLPSALVKNLTVDSEVSFSNEMDRNVCGLIRHRIPSGDGVTRLSKVESDVRFELLRNVFLEFIAVESDLSLEGITRAKRYLPEGLNSPRPSGERIVAIVKNYQKRIIVAYAASIAKHHLTASEATLLLSAIGCISLPEASGPELAAFAGYPSAYKAYEDFSRDLNTALK